MARAHSLLTRDNWQGANLQDIVRDELSTYARFDAVTIDGPPITLGTRHAHRPGAGRPRTFHQCRQARRAVGARRAPRDFLDEPDGRRASAPSSCAGRRRGGPQAQAPAKKGFGIYLIETALSGGGTKVTLEFPPMA